MQPHQQRVIDEKTELDGRLKKLNAFIDGEIFKGLPEDERTRLRKQVGYMKCYSYVLEERIAAF